MLPPSWKSDIQKAVEEKVDADRNQRQSEQNDAAAKIATAIEALSNAQQSQTAHEDRNENINVTLAGITIFLIFLTVVFTGASWWEFSGQLEEMRAAGRQNQEIVQAATSQAAAAAESARTARESYLASERAWVGPRNARIANNPASGQDLSVMVEYGNSGREPATQTIYDTDAFTASEEDDKAGKVTEKVADFTNKCIQMWKPARSEVVYPSTGGLNSTTYTMTKQIDKSLIDADVIGGQKTIILDGCFIYNSAGGIHRSWFCYFYKAGTTQNANWNICSTGNGAD